MGVELSPPTRRLEAQAARRRHSWQRRGGSQAPGTRRCGLCIDPKWLQNRFFTVVAQNEVFTISMLAMEPHASANSALEGGEGPTTIPAR
jgi:hypothetical protein